MPKTIRVLQANVGRRREAPLSILNDSSTQDFELIIVEIRYRVVRTALIPY